MFVVLYLIIVANVLVVNLQELDRPYYDIENVELLFEEFLQTHGKIYPDEEEKKMRFEIFKKNIQDINEKNSRGGAIFATSHFSDLTLEELKNYLGIIPKTMLRECTMFYNVIGDDVPKNFSWLDKGAVTPVKNQLQCGSCWAFSVIANIEGQYFRKNQKLVSFSEQQLVDCSKNNNGCKGGDLDVAMLDIMDMEGVETESSYPYEGKDGNCKFNMSNIAVQLKRCEGFPITDEEKIKKLLWYSGPLAVSMNGLPILKYSKGIMKKEDCLSENDPGLGVLLVGYGTEDGQDYWLMKNSWGADFGEKGYLRMSRGENTCEFLTAPNHPFTVRVK